MNKVKMNGDPKSRGGRSTRLTRKLLDQIEELVSTGVSETNVYLTLGISKQTWMNWKRDSKTAKGGVLKEFLYRYAREQQGSLT